LGSIGLNLWYLFDVQKGPFCIAFCADKGQKRVSPCYKLVYKAKIARG